MTARLPHDKTEELRVVIRAWAQKKWCTRKELESLVGKLNHVCAVVAVLRDLKPRRRYIHLNKPKRLDLEWWNEFLPLWNGVSFFDLPEWEPVPDFELATDASGSLGFGAYNNGE